MACAWTAISLAGCDPFKGPVVDPVAPDIRVTLPAPPADVDACLRQAFPGIPDRALTGRDVASIIARAKLLDRKKTRCGELALAWIEAVHRDFAKP